MQLIYKTVFANVLKRPVKAFQTIYAYDLYRYEYLLLMLYGITTTISISMTELANIDRPFIKTFGTVIFKGMLVGLFWSGLTSHVIYWVGGWFKGRAYRYDITNVYAYASLPALVTLPVMVVCIVILRINGYNGSDHPHAWSDLFFIIIRVKFYLVAALSVYQLILLILGISVAQGFSVFKAIFNIVIAVGVIIAPFALLVGLMKLRSA